MAFWRVMANVIFDTSIHRDQTVSVILARGGTATALTDMSGRPGATADMSFSLAKELNARDIRQQIRNAKASGWIIEGTFHLHRCQHDESPKNWRDCRSLSFELN